MNTELLWVVVIAAIAIAAVGFYLARRRQTEHLRQRFGPEYDRAVHEIGGVSKAEARLREKEARVERLQIRPLSPSDADRFAAQWRDVQTRFVDDPNRSITDADRLVGEVMEARGYPVGDFEQRVDDISVDHPNVVMNYRAAHDIAQDHAAGKATTEDLRQAMVHYRSLFNDLLETERVAGAPSRDAVLERGRS
jgi:hypothetical protein